jgi:DNA-binding transcriptional LysR family regulator
MRACCACSTPSSMKPTCARRRARGLLLPAAASALERCRQLLRDPLLEDGGTQMRLTAKAQALRETVRQMLAGDADAPAASPTQQLSSQAAVTQRVRILMPDYPAQVVAHALYQELATAAPALDLEFQTWLGDADASRPPGTRPDRPGAGQCRAERPGARARSAAGALRGRHAARSSGRPFLTLARWLAYPHLQIACHDSLNRMMDEQVAMQGCVDAWGW